VQKTARLGLRRMHLSILCCGQRYYNHVRVLVLGKSVSLRTGGTAAFTEAHNARFYATVLFLP